MPAARERGCYVFNSDLKVKTPASAYLYPDLSVACDPKFEGDALLNPSMIVEVLAPTTEARDRTEKFDLYATIASLREYVLVATHPPRIEVFLRQDQGWLYRTFHAGRTATFESLGFALDLNPLYVGLPPPDSAGT
jgi:Uma2 family endonuclease